MKKGKKVLCSVLSAALVASYFGMTDFSGDFSDTVVVNADTSLKGDINNDNVLTAVDIMKYKQYMVGQIELDENAFVSADMNSDGLVNIIDGILMINKFIEPTVEEPDVTTPTTPSTPGTDVTDEVKTITLNGDSITSTGSGITISGSVATITEPGEYIVTGNLMTDR